MECATQQTPQELCEEIVIEILARLPAKSLVRFMAVCRLWKSIITSPQFRLLSKRPYKISIHTNRECYTFVEDENLLGFETDFPLKNNLYKKYWNDNAILMGSDNGLLCIGTRNPDVGGATYRVIIWNPCVRRHVLIPDHPIDDHVFEHAYGFGGTISGSDYKYVRIVGFSVDSDNYWMINAFEVYSLKTGTWRPRKFLDYESYRCKGFESTGALLRGRLHFIVSGKRNDGNGIHYSNSVASFELEDEVLEDEDIMLPECLSSSGLFDKIFLQLTLIKESLAVVAYENEKPQIFGVWVMEEKGDVKSWINLCNIDLTMENLRWDPQNMVGLLKNGDLLLGLWSMEHHVELPPKLVTYNLKTRKTSDFGVGVLSSSEFVGFANYCNESLVLLADHRAVADHEVLSMSEQSLFGVQPLLHDRSSSSCTSW